MKLTQSQLTKLTLGNSVLLLSMLVYLAYNHDMTGSEPIPYTQTAVSESGGDKPVGSNRVGTPHKTLIKNILDATIEPLVRAAKDHNQSIDDLLPSEKALEDAIQTGSLQSDECVAILTKLEDGYARFSMPFPTLPQIKTQAREAQEQEIRIYLGQLKSRLQKELEARSEQGQDVLPTLNEIESAALSASYESPETKLAVKKLKSGYSRVDLPFPVEQKTDSARQLNAHFQSISIQLETKAKAAGQQLDVCGEMNPMIDKAVSSGSLDSSASKRFMAAIDACYQRLKLTRSK